MTVNLPFSFKMNDRAVMHFLCLRIENDLVAYAAHVEQKRFIRFNLLVDFVFKRLEIICFKKFDLGLD
jgi:hypothetical protein